MKTTCWIIRLLLIHCFFILLVALSTYFRWLDLVLSLFYLFIIWQAGIIIKSEFREKPLLNLLVIGAVAQLPGYILTVFNLMYYGGKQGIAADFTYGFQIWHTPLLPLFSLYSFPVNDGFISYFIALFFLSPLYLLVLLMPYISEHFVLRLRKHS